MYRIMKHYLVFIALFFLVYACSQTSEPEIVGSTVELNVADILLRTEAEALPESSYGSRTTLLLVHETWSRLKDSLSQENPPSSITLMRENRSIHMTWSDEASALPTETVAFFLEDSDLASVVAGSAESSKVVTELLSGIEAVPSRWYLLPPPPDNSPLRVYPEMTEVDLRNGAVFMVVSEGDSYIFQACYHAPALGPVKKYIVKDCFDKSFVQYEDEFFSMEQKSGSEYRFIVKPIPDYKGDSFSLSFYFLPSYLDHYLLRDGSTTIVCR